MQKIDIIGAFQIAQQRGHSIEEIKQTLINAGYNPQDIEDSLQAFLQGPKPQIKPLPTIKLKKTSPYLLISIIISLIIVLGLLSYLLYRILMS
ncbi:MAG: hypothetical protein QXF25_00885 [Candidatus Pacearchaeota archaeon]